MKLSKDELKQKISESITDNDELVVSLLEDLEDSMNEDSSNNDELQAKYDELLSKYKERFLQKDDNKDEDKNEDKGLEEAEVIDIKEI